MFLLVKLLGIIIFWAFYKRFCSVWTRVCRNDASEHPPPWGSTTGAYSNGAISWQIPRWWWGITDVIWG